MKLHDRLHQMQIECAEKVGEPPPLSLAKIAKKAGLTTSALSRIERNSRDGKEGGEKALRKCAEAWGYSVDWLVTGRGEPKQKELGALEQALVAEAWDPIAVASAQAYREQGRGGDWPAARWQTFLREAHELFARAEKTPVKTTEPIAKPRQIKPAHRG